MNKPLADAIADFVACAETIRNEKPNPFRKKSDAWINWESSAQENYALYDAAKETLDQLLASPINALHDTED